MWQTAAPCSAPSTRPRCFASSICERLRKPSAERVAAAVRVCYGRCYTGPTPTSEEFEERFLALCRAASLPEPEVNAWIGLEDGVAYKADFLWREEGLVAETDGYRFHSSRRAFEHDRMRDQRLTVAGFVVVRLTWRQLTQEPDRVLSTVKKLLARLARP